MACACMGCADGWAAGHGELCTWCVTHSVCWHVQLAALWRACMAPWHAEPTRHVLHECSHACRLHCPLHRINTSGAIGASSSGAGGSGSTALAIKVAGDRPEAWTHTEVRACMGGCMDPRAKHASMGASAKGWGRGACCSCPACFARLPAICCMLRSPPEDRLAHSTPLPHRWRSG